MFALSAALVALAIGAAASPSARAPGLSVEVAAPKSVDTLDVLKLTATITNDAEDDVTVLKYGTILDHNLPTKSFKVTKDGQEASFTGVKLSVDLTALEDDAFVTIPAGKSVTVEHDISALYDFESLGAGDYSFEPITSFRTIGENKEVASALSSFVASKAANVAVSGDILKRNVLDKRSRVVCSDSTKNSFITSSYSEGKSLASIASQYIASQGSSALFKSYFGTSSTSSVKSVFDAVAGESSTSRSLNCNSDPASACTSGVIAYTLTSTTNIYFCSIFFQEVTTSRLCSGTTVNARNIRGGTVLHELTHALSGTDDVGYGCPFDQNLGSSSPSQARINADNYNCFATQVYANTKC